jgi:hypothetical protein
LISMRQRMAIGAKQAQVTNSKVIVDALTMVKP